MPVQVQIQESNPTEALDNLFMNCIKYCVEHAVSVPEHFIRRLYKPYLESFLTATIDGDKHIIAIGCNLVMTLENLKKVTKKNDTVIMHMGEPIKDEDTVRIFEFYPTRVGDALIPMQDKESIISEFNLQVTEFVIRHYLFASAQIPVFINHTLLSKPKLMSLKAKDFQVATEEFIINDSYTRFIPL